MVLKKQLHQMQRKLQFKFHIFIGLLFTSLVGLAQNDFITTWQTNNIGASNDTSITIPTIGGMFLIIITLIINLTIDNYKEVNVLVFTQKNSRLKREALKFLKLLF